MNILFLCTGNSCRSQMAEGWGKTLKGSKYNFYSAGIKKHGLNPIAVEVMQEIGIDISRNESNLIEELAVKEFDYIVTVCSDAHETCPFVENSKIIHKGFDDPPSLTREIKDKEEILKVYRRVRDEIKVFVENLVEYLN